MRKLLAFLLVVVLLSSMGTARAESASQTEIVVFAAASMTEALQRIARQYQVVAPNVTLTFNFDSSGTLQTQIEEGAYADVFISASQKQMDALDASAGIDKNPDAQDFVLQGTRFDLLTNTLVLIVPEGSDIDITSFADAGTDKVDLIALGNSDVPVGQYAQEVFAFLGRWDQLNAAGKVTFASNVKEVLSQVAQAAVDCGVVFASDAATGAGVMVAANAPAGSHKPVNYPAAVLRNTMQPEAAKAFLNYLKGEEATGVFTEIGFAIPQR